MKKKQNIHERSQEDKSFKIRHRVVEGHRSGSGVRIVGVEVDEHKDDHGDEKRQEDDHFHSLEWKQRMARMNKNVYCNRFRKR